MYSMLSNGIQLKISFFNNPNIIAQRWKKVVYLQRVKIANKALFKLAHVSLVCKIRNLRVCFKTKLQKLISISRIIRMTACCRV